MSSGAPAPCVRGPGDRFQCHRRRDNLIIDGEYRSGDAIFPFPEWGSRRLATAKAKRINLVGVLACPIRLGWNRFE
jgi:hypothetical protein